jgi:hypothetical protein
MATGLFTTGRTGSCTAAHLNHTIALSIVSSPPNKFMAQSRLSTLNHKLFLRVYQFLLINDSHSHFDVSYSKLLDQ